MPDCQILLVKLCNLYFGFQNVVYEEIYQRTQFASPRKIMPRGHGNVVRPK